MAAGSYPIGPLLALLPSHLFLFDDKATGFTVDIAAADVTPAGVTFNNTTAYTMQGSFGIAGSCVLTKSGAGPVTISSANTYSGGTIVGAGTLVADADFTLGTGPVTLNGGSLATTLGSTLDNAITLGSDSAVDVSATQTLFLSGVISGTGQLTKSGAGTLNLSGNNTYTGNTTISAGTLIISSGGRLGGGNHAANISNNGSLQYDGSTAQTLGGVISGGGTLTKSGSGTLTLSGANSFTGTITLSTGTLAIGNAAALSAATGITLAEGTLLQPTVGGVSINAPITIGAAATTSSISAPTSSPGGGVVATVTLAGAISGDGDVTFTSSVNQNALSTVRLNAQSTYTGNTTIDRAGTTTTQTIVRLGIDNALPKTTVLNILGQAGTGSGRFTELNLNGFSQELAGLTNTPATSRIQRIVNSNVSAAATLTVKNTGDFTFSGNLGSASANGSVAASAMPGSSNGSNFSLTKDGIGKLTLSGTNNYAGATTVLAGTLSLGVVNAGNELSTVTIAATGATLDLTFAATDTVDKLFIGTTQMAAGQYGAISSVLPVIGIPQITGTGTLTVTSGPPAGGYSAWASLNGAGPNLDDDHDSDGVKNGVEYFLVGPNGNSTGITPLPGVANSGGTHSVTWTKAADYAGIYGTDYVVETSINLAPDSWSSEASPGTVAIDGNNVTYTFPSGTGRFARLKVSGP